MGLSSRTLFKNGGLLLGGQVAGLCIGLVQGILVARALGPSGYGVWGIVLSTCATVRGFLGFRTQEPLTRYLVEYRSKGEKDRVKLLLESALLTDFVTSVAALLVTGIGAGLFSRFFLEAPVSPALFWIYGLTLPFGSPEMTWYCMARDQKEFRTVAIWPVYASAAQFLILVPLAMLGHLTLFGIACTYAFISAVKGACFLRYVSATALAKYGVPLNAANIGECFHGRGKLQPFWGFMKATFFSSAFSTIVKNGDVLVLALFRSDAEVGFFRLAKTLVTQIQSIASALAQVLYQDLNEAVVARQLTTLRAKLKKLTKWWSALVLVMALAASFLARPLIEAFYGKQFAPAYLPFVILLAGVSLTMAIFWVQPLVLALDKIKENLVITLSTGTFAIAASFFFSWRMGAEGSALVLSSTYAIGYLSLLYVSLRELGRLKSADSHGNVSPIAFSPAKGNH